MLEFDPKLDLRVSGNAITLALLGTRYSVTYFKRRGSPGLFAKDILHEVIPASQWPSAEFLAKAWKVANDKARELGWIVRERRLRPHILSFMMAGECRQGIVTC